MSLGVIPLPDRIDGFVLKSSYDRLQAENAKLREFATEMCKQIMSEYCSSSCKHEPSEGCYIAGCWFERRAQELGIEVD